MAATAEYFSELEAVGSSPATSPSPGGSAFHTPRASMSRRPSSRREISMSSLGTSSSPPPVPTSSPPPLPLSSPGIATQNEDGSIEDDISPLDPRRFTPTLHASLVSEILNLRRELDSKHRFIEDLETSLHQSRTEKEDVEDKLAATEKERKSIKRQFQQLENGTLSALEELAKDRDCAKKTSSELKVKLNEAQEKLKKKEEESDRVHSAWEKEQGAWDTERRAFERRVHITETRLKHVIAELEAVHAVQAEMQEQTPQAEDDDHTRDSGLGDESDTASQASPMRNSSHVRTMSNSSRRSFGRYRFSVQSLTGADGQKINGVSLADELQLDEEDEEDMSEAESEVPQEKSPKQGIVARTSQFFDDRAKRMSTATPGNRRPLQAPIELDLSKPTESQTFLNGLSDPIKPAVQYVDTGVQFTPPSSPRLAASKQVEAKGVQASTAYCDSAVQYEPLEIEEIDVPPVTNDHRKDSKVDEQYATELRKSVSTPPLLVDRAQQMTPVPHSPTKRGSMVSAGSQTLDEPPSPPATPGVSPPGTPTQVIGVQLESPELKSISTQTDFVAEQKTAISLPSSKPAPLAIPSINIVPPPSAPSSPKEPKLPPGTKNVSCQTSADLVTMKSVSIQTEEIRIDTRLAKLPPHLHPSAISSNPPTPEAKTRATPVKKRSTLASSLAERSILRASSPADDEIPSSPPEIHAPAPRKQVSVRSSSESLPSTTDRVDGLRRLLRSAVLAPGSDIDGERDDRVEPRSDYIEQEPKVATFSTPSMSGRQLKHMRMGGTRPSPVPEEKDEESPAFKASQPEVTFSTVASGRSSVDTGVSDKGKSIKSNSSKLRRSAMIQSGAAAHRSRTPSIVSVGSSSYFSSKSVGPPFPVPDRASSRKPFSSRSEGSQSPTPHSSGGLFRSRKRGTSSPVGRKDSLRKVRSANVIHRSNSRGKSRSRSRSPTLQQRRRSPQQPALPQDHVVAPAKVYPSQNSADKILSQRPLSVGSKPELARASQGTVVDAIAATMVGEWMWKYVRRRTSFGVPESPQDQMGRPGTDGSMNVTGNGVRHKRWVWLSPYERAIMWSGKQPANNTALMGKTGRKLVIQSVLDVRDNTPLPKNHGIAEPFNRSILILTPARALKFTAMSKERHYTWLTALSFLAHSPLLAPGLASLPPVPDREPPPPRSRGNNSSANNSMKRGGIRDSVRIAKDRARPIKTSSTHQSGKIPEIEFEAAFGSTPVPPIPDMPDVAAEPPSIPRFAHGRNRSLTGPKMPASALRSLGYREVPSPSFPISSLPSPSLDYPSTRVSEASNVTRNNFLDTVGTIRMEAFIDEQNNLSFQSQNSPLSRGGRRRGNTHSPASRERPAGMVLGDDFDVSGSFDPFKDFAR